VGVTAGIAAGTRLAQTNTPLPFTSTGAVVAISVSFGSGQRVEERAYRDGAFLYPYLRSTQSSGAFVLIRDGGWPAEPDVFFDLGSGSAYSLQPILTGCGAAWSLLGTPGTPSSFKTDRGPNGYALDTSWTPNPVPDLITGQYSVCNDLVATAARADCISQAANTALFSIGDFTFIGRVYWRPNGASYQTCLDYSSAFSTGSGAPACLYRVSVNSTGQLGAYHQYGPSVGSLTDVIYQSTITLVRGAWTPFAIRRVTSGGNCTYQVNTPATTQTSGALTKPNGAANGTRQLNIGQWGAWDSGGLKNGFDPWAGGMADFQILPSRAASDAEIAAAFTGMGF
jgi:hypothetical protein